MEIAVCAIGLRLLFHDRLPVSLGSCFGRLEVEVEEIARESVPYF
jgi:hypothetical protein